MPIHAVASLIEVNNLEKHFNTEMILDVILAIFSNVHFSCYEDRHYDVIQINSDDSAYFYDSLDVILLAFNGDDQEKLAAFKKELFADENKKLYISLPLQFVDKQFQDGLNWMSSQLWPEMVNDFIDWICSSDKDSITDLKNKFWKSQKAIEAENRLETAVLEDVDYSSSEGDYSTSEESN